MLISYNRCKYHMIHTCVCHNIHALLFRVTPCEEGRYCLNSSYKIINDCSIIVFGTMSIMIQPVLQSVQGYPI